MARLGNQISSCSLVDPSSNELSSLRADLSPGALILWLFVTTALMREHPREDPDLLPQALELHRHMGHRREHGGETAAGAAGAPSPC